MPPQPLHCPYYESLKCLHPVHSPLTSFHMTCWACACTPGPHRSSGTCEPLTFTQPTCLGLTSQSCETWYEGETYTIALHTHRPLHNATSHLAAATPVLEVTLEALTTSFDFESVGALCTIEQLTTSVLSCNQIVPSLPATDALPVYRLRATYFAISPWESAVALSQPFVVRPRAEWAKRSFAAAKRLGDSNAGKQAMELLCNEVNATDNATAAVVLQACGCADAANNGLDCDGFISDVLPEIRKQGHTDGNTVACNALRNALGVRVAAQTADLTLSGLRSVISGLGTTAAATQEVVVVQVSAEITRSRLITQIRNYDDTKSSLTSLIGSMRLSLAFRLQTHNDMVGQLAQLQIRARSALMRLYSETGLVADLNASRHAEMQLTRNTLRGAIDWCNSEVEAARRKAKMGELFPLAVHPPPCLPAAKSGKPHHR